MTVKIKFEKIDDWNRPVFKSITSRSRYGSTEILFGLYATEKEVLKKIRVKDLCYFGQSFNCEPMGTPVYNIEIVI